MSQEFNSPKGQLLLRTLAMPADTNANGDIFGWRVRFWRKRSVLVASLPFLFQALHLKNQSA